MGTNLKRQMKNLIRVEDNILNVVGFFVLGAVLLVAGAITRMAFLGLIGGGCLLLGLDRVVQRNNKKAGGAVSDLKADEEKNRRNNK